MKNDHWLKVELAALLAVSLVMLALAARSGWQDVTSWFYRLRRSDHTSEARLDTSAATAVMTTGSSAGMGDSGWTRK